MDDLPNRKLTRELRFEIEEFHTEYCSVLDSGALEKWANFFSEDALYRITARENADAGLRAGLVYAEGRNMIKDRAFAILNTQMFAPRYLQLSTSNVHILDIIGMDDKILGDGIIKSKTNYLLLQTLVDGPTTLHQSGRYFDTFIRQKDRILIQERQCIYDSTIKANDLVYPV